MVPSPYRSFGQASQPGARFFLASQVLKVVTDSLQLSLGLMIISSSPAMHKQLFFANQNE
jgi:hypothetical protein